MTARRRRSTSNPCWRENSSGRSAIRHFFGRSGSIPRSIRSYGPTVPISIRPRCTTGQTTCKRSSAGRAAGRAPRIAPSEETGYRRPPARTDYRTQAPPPGPVVSQGFCYALFAYDAGLAIDLDEAERLVTATTQRATIPHKHRAPKYFEYHPSPLRATQATEPLTIGAHRTLPFVDTVLYDF